MEMEMEINSLGAAYSLFSLLTAFSNIVFIIKTQRFNVRRPGSQ